MRTMEAPRVARRSVAKGPGVGVSCVGATDGGVEADRERGRRARRRGGPPGVGNSQLWPWTRLHIM